MEDAVRRSLAPVSAAGYFFAKNLSDSLDVPVGLISSSWGGSMIESWMPEEAFKGSPQLNDGYANGSYYGLPVADHYRTMIAPLVHSLCADFCGIRARQMSWTKEV